VNLHDSPFVLASIDIDGLSLTLYETALLKATQRKFELLTTTLRGLVGTFEAL
jgi:hypothetical protein